MLARPRRDCRGGIEPFEAMGRDHIRGRALDECRGVFRQRIIKISGPPFVGPARPCVFRVARTMRSRCQTTRLAVPCPSQVPEGQGHEVVCPPNRDAALPPCTGRAGELQYPIFFMDVTEFRVGPGYVGVDGKPVGHLTISAAKQDDSPGPPCFGTVVGTFRIGDEVVTEYSCTNDSLRVQRDARHGEGAYVGHLLLSWSANGIDYAVSAHGHTQANLALVKRLAASITFTAPARAD